MGKHHVIISTDAKKASDKIQHAFNNQSPRSILCLLLSHTAVASVMCLWTWVMGQSGQCPVVGDETPWVLPPHATRRVAPAGGTNSTVRQRCAPGWAHEPRGPHHGFSDLRPFWEIIRPGNFSGQSRAGNKQHQATTQKLELFEWVLNIVRKPRDVAACRAFSWSP